MCGHVGAGTHPTLSISASGTALTWNSDGGSWKTNNITVSRLNNSGYPDITFSADIVSGAAGTTLEGETTLAAGSQASVIVNFRNAAANTGTVRVKATDAIGNIAYSANITLS